MAGEDGRDHVDPVGGAVVEGEHHAGLDRTRTTDLGHGVVQIDEDARIEYWTRIRERPDLVQLAEYRAGSSTRTAGTTRRNDEQVRGRIP